MLQGFQAMSLEDLQVAARVAGIQPEASREQLVDRLTAWVGSAVGASTDEPEEVENSALEWLSGVAGTPREAGEGNADFEERLWERLSEDAARHLMATWKVASSMASLGPPDALPDERKLLEKVAARLLPSEKARGTMRTEWEAMCKEPARHHSEVIDRLAPDLKVLAERPELVKPTLVLALVVAMADSNFELEEARLYEKIAAGLGVDQVTSGQLKDAVSRTFWDSKESLSPRNPGSEEMKAAHDVSLRAAHLCLEKLGALNLLEEEARSGFLAGLHRGLLKDRDFQKGVKAWRKTPLHWPIGFAVGVSLYLRNRMRGGSHKSLMQVLYLAYTHQARATVG